MATQPAARIMTAEQFAERYMDVMGCELVRGRVVEAMSGGWDHGLVVNNAARFLSNWAVKSRKGRVLSGEVGILTDRGPDTVRGADVVYFSYKRVPKGRRYSGFASISPDLVVEVLGVGKGWDAVLKKGTEYLSMGVARVWILDPRRETVHILSADGPPRQLTRRNTIRDDAILPGFSCRVADFFAD